MTNHRRFHALCVEVGSRKPASVTALPNAEDATEHERALHELRGHMTDVAKEAEKTVLAAAFCVGMWASSSTH